MESDYIPGRYVSTRPAMSPAEIRYNSSESEKSGLNRRIEGDFQVKAFFR